MKLASILLPTYCGILSVSKKFPSRVNIKRFNKYLTLLLVRKLVILFSPCKARFSHVDEV